ncbi:hypothetical protein I4U23_024783 [Adineta vaga]|nr:hypothetical protein I4U23_024783 [Adineta vaga]
MHQVPNETMKRFSIPPSAMPRLPSVDHSVGQHLLWISRQQQQHPSLHAHPLKNTIRVNSRGTRFKFDGKQWRPLCQSTDGYECRNLAFRSSLCQKHFYKVHLFKRPYIQKPISSTQMPAIPPISLKRPLLVEYDESQAKQEKKSNEESKETDEDEDDLIEVIENHDAIVSKSEYRFFSIDDEPQTVINTSTAPFSIRPEGATKRSNSITTESTMSNESESLHSISSISKINESIRLDVPPLTRTEEKSLANELITQLPDDVSLIIGEQTARRRVCEIVFDNYSQKLFLENMSSNWFYDFLLRNPRVPIHFQSWFSSVKPTLPNSDHLVDIKIWELGLITRSFTPSASSSSP